MDTQHAVAEIERRAFAARVTATEMCKKAGVHDASWSRAKRRGVIGVKLLRRLEDALGEIEKARGK